MTRRCDGSIHTIGVPAGMTTDEAWAEITTMGRIRGVKRIAYWTNVRCPGGDDCACYAIDLARTYRHYHNDRLVEATLIGRLLHWRDRLLGRR